MSEARKWSGKTDGADWMFKALIGLFKVFPLPLMYLLMGLVIPFYMLVNRKGYLSIYHYLRRGHGWGPIKGFLGCYANHFLFGTAILDRFAAYAGRRFKTDIPDMHLFRDLEKGEEGFVMFASHIGNVELCGYMLRSEHKRMNAIVFPGEKDSIQHHRSQMLDVNNIRLIPAAPDMSWLFTLNAALSDGEIVSIHADRSFGSPRTLTVPILGAEAPIPQGPFSVAAMRQLPVLTAFAIKSGLRRYYVVLKRLDTPEMSQISRDEAMRLLSQRYAQAVDEVLKRWPLQWYNFFEFWPQ